MDQRTKDFWGKYVTAPDVLAVIPATIVGKSVSAHPGQPVSVTLQATLPDGSVTTMPLVFPGEEDAAHIPAMSESVVENGENKIKYRDPVPVYLLLISQPPKEKETGTGPTPESPDALTGTDLQDDLNPGTEVPVKVPETPIATNNAPLSGGYQAPPDAPSQPTGDITANPEE